MAISEAKKKIVIDNYFKKECDVNTSIKEAFIKGFELGLRKAPIPQPKKGCWIYDYTPADGHRVYHCSECGCYLKPKHSESLDSFKWCSLCGADMREVEE